MLTKGEWKMSYLVKHLMYDWIIDFDTDNQRKWFINNLDLSKYIVLKLDGPFGDTKKTSSKSEDVLIQLCFFGEDVDYIQISNFDNQKQYTIIPYITPIAVRKLLNNNADVNSFFNAEYWVEL